MKSSRTNRGGLPTMAGLDLYRRNAQEDLEWLGWYNLASLDLLWALAGTADADLALNSIVRLAHMLDDTEGSHIELDKELRENAVFRVRLFALLGGSAALADHLVANPQQWRALTYGIPSREEMFVTLLSAVAAQPAHFLDDTAVGLGANAVDQAQVDCTTAGTYCAEIGGIEAERILRLEYRTLLLRIAALDLAGTYADNGRHEGGETLRFSTVVHALSDLADAALTAALAVAVHNIYGQTPLDSTFAVIAMGKCGARELNYISDVDVIFVAGSVTTRITRLASEFIRIGSRCYFEVDAALRPEGKRGALVRTLESHLAYYQRWAQTWEFQAQLKARPMTGSLALGQDYLDALSPLVWQASQRDSFVSDVQIMRRRVVENVPATMRDRELKLGDGGLRDVEFAVQLLQLVHGRADESLRTLATVDALTALIDGGYVGREDGAELIFDYEFLRLLEHRLQLHKLKRTHTLPDYDDEHNMRWLARSAGFLPRDGVSSTEKLKKELRTVRRTILSLHRKLFYRPLLNSVAQLDAGTIKLTPVAAKLQLGALGYQYPDRAFEHLRALAAGSGRKAKIQAMLLPMLMEWLAHTADPDAGLLNYRKLSDAANDRTWFLRMLRDEGIVGQRLMRILGNSPFAAELIISAPDCVKQFGDGTHGPKLLEINPETVSRSLVRAASRHEHPEKAISVACSLRRVELARLAAADLLNLMEVKEICHGLSIVWDAVLEAALHAEIRFSLQGKLAPATIAVIGMGRLGGAELGFGSDADVMFVCEPADGVDDTTAVRWASEICERMRTRLAKPSGDPPLEVDLGLRPEGRSGAVVRTLDSYYQYYKRWGEVWEIQALLRATWIAGDTDLGVRFCQMIDQFRYPTAGADEKMIQEVRRMKARVDNERLPRGADRNTHTKLGRGALTDIEWTAQLLTLMYAHKHKQLHSTSTLTVLEAIKDKKLIAPEKVDILIKAWLTATQARNAIVLVRGKRADQLPLPGPQLAAVAGAAGWNPNDYQEFLENYLKITRHARKVVDEVFWGEPVGEHEV
ncbi:bifunctional [glutamine synthetase] adenylyltransferase/[glutamine synthetase]-adenylyl-L-tyrosine phosphorylase [Corynebacterium kutscheri]|uniref:Glutamate-ammonia-ligase adenylyltransferase n=1 Tax=Corynebacterium kutscheri TaxID=35755 RepID=A0AB38VS46_9CORY|nr:bifunctional [glutamine synthetase] adenylyltransferase/[glutamine synthetase]-adenylyl-L-tyrosine phosphorylase [Corynebacterium kutscheri]VEH06845.1 glutamate-ammonia-ligase adenylyltransferase [Corynebacterium kutscheri]